MLPINMDELYEQAKYEASRDTGLDSMDNKIKEWFDCLYEESIDKLLDDTFDVRFTKYREAEKCYEDERDAACSQWGIEKGFL